MGYTTGERDIQRAKDMRKLAKGVRDAGAKRDLEDAAGRLERRGARKARKIGRKTKIRVLGPRIPGLRS